MDFSASYEVDREIIEMLREKPGLNRLERQRDGETFVFRFDEKSKDKLRQMLGIMAADKDLPLNWYDTAVISQEVRRRTEVYQEILHGLCAVVAQGRLID